MAVRAAAARQRTSPRYSGGGWGALQPKTQKKGVANDSRTCSAWLIQHKGAVAKAVCRRPSSPHTHTHTLLFSAFFKNTHLAPATSVPVCVYIHRDSVLTLSTSYSLERLYYTLPPRLYSTLPPPPLTCIYPSIPMNSPCAWQAACLPRSK